ncbi:aminoglycoside phosphotransferase family protein [Paenibacillus hamazuiensis]|uniref:aminoglycoside phosphotransferase family protein n=1 Tax=Paenibacillus hamazuiensis TaxID=2936508 RepID=UPI00200D0667|nr:aminoglycoside phosphotransferase family protein [Paenibacillus hamazuiensis]
MYTKAHVGKLTRRFGIIPLKFRWRPSVYQKKAVIRIQTKTRSYALKPYYRSPLIPSGTIQQMKEAAGRIQYLIRRGYGHMPRWLYADNGKLWVIYKGKPFYMTEWIRGRGLREAADYEQLGRVTAAIHQPSNDLPGIHESDFFTLKQVAVWMAQDSRFLGDKDGATRKSAAYRRWFRTYEADCRSLSERTWAEMKDPEIAALLEQEISRPALIHGDITSSNVIIAEDGRLYIIDWDRVRLGSVYAELAKALANTTQFRPEFIRSFLQGYEEARPLERAERRLIASLFRLPREAWTAARFPNRKGSGELIGKMVETWPDRLKAAAFLDEWAAQ